MCRGKLALQIVFFIFPSEIVLTWSDDVSLDIEHVRLIHDYLDACVAVGVEISASCSVATEREREAEATSSGVCLQKFFSLFINLINKIIYRVVSS